MQFEIEKVNDGTFTTRIRVNGKVTFSNNGLNTKQAAYKKIIGLYKGMLDSLYISYVEVFKSKNGYFTTRTGNGKVKISNSKMILVNLDMPLGMHNEIIEVKEINC